MRTSFQLSASELTEVVSMYVAKKYSGAKFRIESVKADQDGTVLIDAVLEAKERKPRAPREAKEKTTTKLKKA